MFARLSLWLPNNACDGGTDATLEQQPIEPDDERSVTATDHVVSLLGCHGHAAKNNAAVTYRGFEFLNGGHHIRMIDLALESHRGCQVARTNEQKIQTRSTHDLGDGAENVDVL